MKIEDILTNLETFEIGIVFKSDWFEKIIVKNDEFDFNELYWLNDNGKVSARYIQEAIKNEVVFTILNDPTSEVKQMIDYEKYYQKGGSYLIPTEIFNELLEENKKYKEVIDKAIELLESQPQDMMGNYYFDDNIAEQLLINLKEVE